MKAEYLDLKKNTGEIRLFPESLDDIWHMKHLVRAGDLVFATTFRSLETATDKIRPEKMEKKPVRLGIRVEKVEFHHAANRLRIAGVIEYGADAGSHHTLNVEPGYEISVIKSWNPLDLERIERAVKASTAGVIHVLSIEEGEAQLFRLRQFGPEPVVTITGGSAKRETADGRSVFFANVYASLADTTGPVVIAGPGFVKEEFVRYISTQDAGLAGRCITVETRRVGRGAVQEAVGKGILTRINEDMQLAREVQLMEEFLERIGTGAPVAYGIDEVREAVRFGAVDEVLVSDEMMRSPAIADILDEAEKRRAAIVVFSSEFEPGERLAALGGIAALLRYAIK